jgi:DNA-binding transcriptional regulator YiaG
VAFEETGDTARPEGEPLGRADQEAIFIMSKNTSLSIRDMRNRLSMTQEEFAHALGITVSTVNRWENGHSEPSKLARATITRLAGNHGIFVEPTPRDQPSIMR